MSSDEDYYDDECPITLEPLKDLPYPPFPLTSLNNTTKHYFDGAALATFIVSQGAFTNPLTREPLKYEDCVKLDEYLDEYVFNGHNYSQSERISVREAWLLRESIKVKVTSSGDGYDENNRENQRRREEVLRNEASVALRGLFVFGHERSSRRRSNHSDDNPVSQTTTLPSTSYAGGFNLHHNPDSSLSHSWGLGSLSNQEGLLIIDDDEAAHEAADIAAWREVQDEFPFLGETRTSTSLPIPCDQNTDMPSQILATVRQTANLTIQEDKQKKEATEKARQRYFLEALERKRRRIDARRKAKEDTAKVLAGNMEAEAVKQSARAEIDRWLSQKWNEWETNALEIETKQQTKNDCLASTANEPCEVQIISHKSSPPLTEEEKAAKAAAKKKAKRQKVRERAKEKKQIEKLEREKKERAVALQKKKESSDTKCAHCGGGVLGSGYDKFDKKYCSTKCARSGSK